MASLTYTDIIDDKVASWQNGLKKLQEQAEKASSDRKADLTTRLEQLRLKVEGAAVELHTLDERENVGNTMETKDKILKIFNSIDQGFPRFEEQTPYML